MGKCEVSESINKDKGEKKVPKHSLSYYQETSSLFWDREMLYEYYELISKKHKPLF